MTDLSHLCMYMSFTRIGHKSSCKSPTCVYCKSYCYMYVRIRTLLYYITIGPSLPRSLSITREFQDGIELNWLPSTEPNGEVHYVIYYTPKGSTEETIDTGSNLTHYNLTGFERNRVYTNIAVQAVNSAGSSERSAVIAQYNPTPPGESCMVSNSSYVDTVLQEQNVLYICIVKFNISLLCFA